MKSKLFRWGLTAVMVGMLAACGGGGGGDTTAAAPGTGTSTPSAPSATTVSSAVTTAAAIATNDTSTTPTAAFSVLQAAGLPTVSVNSPPKVNFTVFSDGAVVKGLTASNVSVIIAKLVPGTKGAPDQWQSYTYRTEKATATVGPGGKPVLATAVQATTDPKQTDAALLAAQLTYNDAGYYTYTFSTDIKDSTKTNGVAFDPAAIHRVALQLSYTNKAGATVRVNPYFDFTIDASGNAVPVTDPAKGHKVVDITSCNQCHDKLALHGGGRVDTQYCVLCHNASTTDANSGNVLDLRIMAHKIHAGEGLKTLFNEDYTIWGYQDGQNSYAEVGFPQNLTNCTKCHDNTKAPQADNWKNVPSRAACGSCHAGINFATGKGVTIADATMGLTTSTSGHIGGAKADDSQCALCHGPVDIPVYHQQITAAPNADLKTAITKYANPSALPSGAYKIEYAITGVSVDSARKVSVNFQVKKDGAAVNFGTYNASTNPNIIPNTIGGPSLKIDFNVTQDGITSPADFNASMTAPAIGVPGGSVSTANGTAGTWSAASTTSNVWATPAGVTSSGITWKMTGPDATNTYTITSSLPLPASTTMVRAFMYGTMTQTNLADYPYANASAADFTKYTRSSDNSTRYAQNKPGLVIAVQNASAFVTSTGFTARRTIVDNNKCNACHNKLGLFTEATFHGGARNDGTTCNSCHTNNVSSKGWSYGFNTFIHGIHGASKRDKPYTFAADWSTVGYPGILNNCETCHVPGSYDFSGTANAAAVGKMLFNTVGTGTTVAADANTSPWIAQTAGTAYGTGFSAATSTGAVVTTEAQGTTLVTSPIVSACFSCHDNAAAKTHMSSDGGGSLYEARTTALLKTENCLFCHGTGKLVDIKVQHAK